MPRYEHTLPTFMCEKPNENCVAKNAGDVEAQNNCTGTIRRFRGELTPAPDGPSTDNTPRTPIRLTSSTTTTSISLSITTGTQLDRSSSPPGSSMTIKESTDSASGTPTRGRR